jgi:hypothetical protein
MQKTPLSIRIIYILTSIIYYLSALATLLGMVLAFVLLTGFLGDDLQLHIKMPVEVDFKEVGNVKFLGKEVDVEIVNAMGDIHFIDTPKIIARALAIPMLIIFPVLFWLVFLFHRFIRNVREGNIFDARNFYLLRNLSFGLAGIWFLTVVYFQTLRYFLLSGFSFEEIQLTTNSNWYGGLLLGALFTWVLSHVFLKGLELQEENELTI